MENNQIDFNSDINKFSNNINKNIKINNISLTLNLFEYCDIRSCEIINNWEICLGMLGKSKLFKSKNIMKVVYCLLTDSCVINSINNTKSDIDLFDVILERFLRIDVIDDKERNIKLQIFPICNTLIIIDCRDLKNYKIYELHNIKSVKEYYGTSKINFDEIINDIKLEPIFTSSINKLMNDYKTISIINFKKDDGIIINKLNNFLLHEMEIEKKIQKEYCKFYKSAKLNKKKNKGDCVY